MIRIGSRAAFTDAECDELVRKAARVLTDDWPPDTAFAIAEVIDCAWDQSEDTVYLTWAEDLEVSAALTRSAYALLGVASGASDGAGVSFERLRAIVRKENR